MLGLFVRSVGILGTIEVLVVAAGVVVAAVADIGRLCQFRTKIGRKIGTMFRTVADLAVFAGITALLSDTYT